jgi:hypothetical protein
MGIEERMNQLWDESQSRHAELLAIHREGKNQAVSKPIIICSSTEYLRFLVS